MSGSIGLFREIERRYGVTLPAEYRQMSEKGWFDFDPAKRGQDESYLWLNDMEWMPLEHIRDHEFPEYCKPGFVPFAFTGGGDHWCWYPESAVDGVMPVVLCPHDDKNGEFYAPHFCGAMYRQMMDFAGGVTAPWSEEEIQHLNRWATDLGPFFPETWRQTVSRLLLTPPSWEEHAAIVRRDLAFSRLNEMFQWMED